MHPNARQPPCWCPMKKFCMGQSLLSVDLLGTNTLHQELWICRFYCIDGYLPGLSTVSAIVICSHKALSTLLWVLHVLADSTPRFLYTQAHAWMNLCRKGSREAGKHSKDQARTGCEAVTAGVALQLLFTVLTVEVIFTGRAQVHWIFKEKDEKRERINKNSAGFSVSAYLAAITISNDGSCLNSVTSYNHSALAVHRISSANWTRHDLLNLQMKKKSIPGMYKVIQLSNSQNFWFGRWYLSY